MASFRLMLVCALLLLALAHVRAARLYLLDDGAQDQGTIGTFTSIQTPDILKRRIREARSIESSRPVYRRYENNKYNNFNLKQRNYMPVYMGHRNSFSIPVPLGLHNSNQIPNHTGSNLEILKFTAEDATNKYHEEPLDNNADNHLNPWPPDDFNIPNIDGAVDFGQISNHEIVKGRPSENVKVIKLNSFNNNEAYLPAEHKILGKGRSKFRESIKTTIENPRNPYFGFGIKEIFNKTENGLKVNEDIASSASEYEDEILDDTTQRTADDVEIIGSEEVLLPNQEDIIVSAEDTSKYNSQIASHNVGEKDSRSNVYETISGVLSPPLPPPYEVPSFDSFGSASSHNTPATISNKPVAGSYYSTPPSVLTKPFTVSYHNSPSTISSKPVASPYYSSAPSAPSRPLSTSFGTLSHKPSSIIFRPPSHKLPSGLSPLKTLSGLPPRKPPSITFGSPPWKPPRSPPNKPPSISFGPSLYKPPSGSFGSPPSFDSYESPISSYDVPIHSPGPPNILYNQTPYGSPPGDLQESSLLPHGSPSNIVYGSPSNIIYDTALFHGPNNEASNGPVYTFVKTDHDGNIKWGVRHNVGSQYAGSHF